MAPPGPYPPRTAIRLPPDAYCTGDPFIITICAASRADPFLDPELARLVLRHLDRALPAFGGPIRVYCLMPEHLHGLLFAASNLLQWVAAFKSATTTAARKAGLAVRLWQRRFHDRHIPRTGEALEWATRYIVENPVRAGLVARWEDWPYTRIAWE